MKQPPRQFAVTLVRDGTQYHGTYEIAHAPRSGNLRILRVSYSGRSKKTHLGGFDAETLARMLLGELVTESART